MNRAAGKRRRSSLTKPGAPHGCVRAHRAQQRCVGTRVRRRGRSAVVPGDPVVAQCLVRTCGGRPRVQSGLVRSQGATHGLALPGLTSPGKTAEGLSLQDGQEPQHSSWTSAPDSRTPCLNRARPWPGRTGEACPELARSPRTVLPRARACRTLVPTAHQCGLGRYRGPARKERHRHLPRPARG